MDPIRFVGGIVCLIALNVVAAILPFTPTISVAKKLIRISIFLLEHL